MPRPGDTFTVQLSETHLDWGQYRNPTNRDPIAGEGFIPIPKDTACSFDIYNSNWCQGNRDQLGINIYNCTSVDGDFEGQLKAQGSSAAGDPYAKQFAARGDLKALGSWLAGRNAQPGDRVRVTWTSATELTIEHIPS